MAADYDYLLERARRNAKSFTFAELCELASGHFTLDRRRGSHHVFVREGCRPMVFQPRHRDPKMAKPYQVRQLVTTIDSLEAIAVDSHYSAVVEWSPEDEEFVAFSPEFSGASGSGETAEAAITELRESIDVLLETYAEKKLSIPKPRLREEFSGQVRLRLPKDLHRELAITAERQGVSLNTLFVSYLSRGLGRDQEHQIMRAETKARSSRVHEVS